MIIDNVRYKVDLGKAGNQLNKMIGTIRELSVGFQTIESLGDNVDQRLKRLLDMTGNIITSFFDPDEYITWVEISESLVESVLCSMKKEYSEFLSTQILGSGAPVALVSGTLTIGGSFEHFKSKFGYSDRYPTPFVLRNNFNYESNRVVYLSDEVPSPRNRDESYYNHLTKTVGKLLDLSQGRALVLFTNYDDLQNVYNRLLKQVYTIIKQDRHSNNRLLLEQFRKDVSSTLFATGSFFEGIDIRGESLEHVIITKLPYPILDPVLEAEIRNAGTDRMTKVLLPRMIIQLRQAIGRLIRCETDRGIVSVLDSRLNNESYPALSLVLESIHPSKVITDFNVLQDQWHCVGFQVQ